MKRTTQKRIKRTLPLRKWAIKAGKRTKQSGGFLSLIIAGLVAAGVSASTAAAAGAVIAPVVAAAATGAATAAGAAVVNKIAKGPNKLQMQRKAARIQLRTERKSHRQNARAARRRR
jgi:hypothetical protein